MNNRSHLVPTQITDANGKPTTVYRKPTDSKAPTKKLPAPRTARKITPDAALNDALLRLHAAGFVRSSDRSNNVAALTNNLILLAQYAPKTLDDFIEHLIAADSTMRGSWEWALISQDILRPSDMEGKDAARKVSQRYQRRMAVQSLVRSIQSHHPAEGADAATERVMWAMDEFFTLKSDADMFRAGALCFSIRHLSEDITETHKMDGSAWAVDFISKNLDAVEPFIGELIARRTTDPEVIEQLLSTHSALAEGNL